MDHAELNRSPVMVAFRLLRGATFWGPYLSVSAARSATILRMKYGATN